MKRMSLATDAIRILAIVLLAVNMASAAATEKVIHNFVPGNSGASPESTLVFDRAGNLYGTTSIGGSYACDIGCGVVFQLTPNPGGGWTYHAIHAFRGGNDGAYPYFTSGLVIDPSGNVYGTTYQGGTYGYGCIFEVSPTSDGSWRETVIHNFDSPDGPSGPSGLTMDASGNLYGTTPGGGTNGLGTVYELSPAAGGSWTETVLLSFDGENGSSPLSSVSMDSIGNLYGTALGGPSGSGIVFELSPTSDGSWTENVLYNFPGGQKGGDPEASVLIDATGNLYGTTSGTYGSLFKLTPNPDGTWTETTLHIFSHSGDGEFPGSVLAQDSAGNLYGTTYVGGSYGAGIVYKFTPNAGGGWTERIVYNFTGGADGNGPLGGITLDPAGHLFGTTSNGGSAGYGVVFQIQQ
jgi:uncharacterized repeat protein (TIGR03803 family)